MSEQADRELVERARRGDAAAIGELFLRYWRAARAAAFGVTGDLDTREALRDYTRLTRGLAPEALRAAARLVKAVERWL